MFLKTKNIDDYLILIPVNCISEIILYDKPNDDDEYSIIMFSKDEHVALAREDYDDVEVARLRFETIAGMLCAMLRRVQYSKTTYDYIRDKELEEDGKYWCYDCETVCHDMAELKAHQDLKCI